MMHRKCKTPIYYCWRNMINRCYWKKGPKYHRYGGRGIKVCRRWLLFINFYQDMGEPPVGMSLDRKDNDGDYTPENCRWATQQKQQNNKSTNHQIQIGGNKQTIADWCRDFGIKTATVHQRVRNGWGIEEAIQTPTGQTGVSFKLPVMIKCKGRVLTVQQWSEETGLNTSTIYSRLKRGWSKEQVVTPILKFSRKQNQGG